MLTFDQIKELLELVANHRMTGLELERSGFRLKVDGYPAFPASPAPAAPPAPQLQSAPAAPAAPAPAPAPAAAPAVAEPQAAAPKGEDDLPEGTHIVTSPIVGTFYRKPNPDSDAFASTGDRVEEGDVLCIVEAMKLMNEIESDVAGEVIKIFPKDAQAVEFGEKLFAILPG